METKISSNLPPWRPKVHKGTFLRIAFLSILFQILLERLPHTYYRSFFLVGSTPTKWRVPVSCKLDGNSVADPGEGPGGPAPLISRLNWGSKGRKLFLDPPPPPPLSKGLDDRTLTLSQGLDPAWHWKHSVAYIRHVSALWRHAYLLFHVRDPFPFRHVFAPETNDQVSVTFLLLHFRSFFF